MKDKEKKDKEKKESDDILRNDSNEDSIAEETVEDDNSDAGEVSEDDSIETDGTAIDEDSVTEESSATEKESLEEGAFIPEAYSDNEVTDNVSDEADISVPEYLKDEVLAATAPNANKNRNLAIIIIAIVVVLVAAIVLILMNKDDGAGDGSTVAPDVVATVGSSEITQGMVDRESALIIFNNFGQSLDALTPEEQQIYKNQILVFFFVQAESIKEYLRVNELDALSEAQLATIDQNVDAYYASLENADETLTAMGITREDVQYFVEINEYISVFQEKVIADNPVTDEEIEQFYYENQAYFVTPYQISASHILIMDADHTPEKRAELEAILARVNAGEDFAELAMEFSEDTGSAANGGDVGYFGETNNFVPEFSAAALALENIGDVSDIVETDYGYHIIKMTDKQDAAIEPLDAVKSEILPYLQSLRVEEFAMSLKENTEITYYIEVDPATGEPPIDPPTTDAESIPEIVVE